MLAHLTFGEWQQQTIVAPCNKNTVIKGHFKNLNKCNFLIKKTFVFCQISMIKPLFFLNAEDKLLLEIGGENFIKH